MVEVRELGIRCDTLLTYYVSPCPSLPLHTYALTHARTHVHASAAGHVTYLVSSQVVSAAALPEYTRGPKFSVRRRFRDFVALAAALKVRVQKCARRLLPMCCVSVVCLTRAGLRHYHSLLTGFPSHPILPLLFRMCHARAACVLLCMLLRARWSAPTAQVRHRGVFLPPRPEKNAVEGQRMSEGFVEERRLALERYLNRLARHPTLAACQVRACVCVCVCGCVWVCARVRVCARVASDCCSGRGPLAGMCTFGAATHGAVACFEDLAEMCAG
jgi:hypothetical protein